MGLGPCQNLVCIQSRAKSPCQPSFYQDQSFGGITKKQREVLWCPMSQGGCRKPLANEPANEGFMLHCCYFIQLNVVAQNQVFYPLFPLWASFCLSIVSHVRGTRDGDRDNDRIQGVLAKKGLCEKIVVKAIWMGGVLGQ
jgi:hypothetical protein